ncbi:pancreatic lipase-related protein 2-like isoform X2 [Daphnia pulicaria]|uniref:pancreatic lipase-related protein 2-like isoform X2 n=1 Tax=Daphnia pulicaria TaxID=35523 RepID=UPI001EEA77D8|nr:pancreatic lipase-related protein 2-like isoform X2 [Daphnia pulicaria]
MISVKCALIFRIIFFTFFLFNVGSSSEPDYPDTIRTQLRYAHSFDPLNPSFVKIEKQIQDELIETTVINSRNRAATDTIKVAELNDPNLTLNLTQTLAPGLALNADSSVCYDDLGCITRFSFADPILWPINLLPEDREKIDTHFTLSTRDQSTPWPGVLISGKDPNGITSASFKATRPTKFYVHGWLSTGYEDRYKTFVERLLANGDFNVIVVHWGGGAETSYNQAFVNIRLVGLEIAFLVKTLVGKLGVTPSDVHLIGHSLGAHTSGYAGEKIANLGRITGLDPAGWYFRRMPTFARLDPSDAQFVDAVHTDGEGILAVGLLEPLGHLDFYPNGGGRQPGCILSELRSAKNLSSNNLIDDVTNATSCSHMRVLDLYSESFLPDACQSIAYKCSDYESFQKAECTSCGSDNSQCTPFGLQANNYPIGNQDNVKLYFNTGESSPYCLKVSLAKPRRAKPTVTGIIRLSISGQQGTLSKVKLPAIGLEHGKDHRFLLTVPNNLGSVQRVNLGWKYLKKNSLDVTCILRLCTQRLYVNSVTISLMNSYPEETIKANTLKICPQSSPGVIGPFFSLAFDSSCPTTLPTSFNLLSYLRPWTNWLGI